MFLSSCCPTAGSPRPPDIYSCCAPTSDVTTGVAQVSLSTTHVMERTRLSVFTSARMRMLRTAGRHLTVLVPHPSLLWTTMISTIFRMLYMRPRPPRAGTPPSFFVAPEATTRPLCSLIKRASYYPASLCPASTAFFAFFHVVS